MKTLCFYQISRLQKIIAASGKNAFCFFCPSGGYPRSGRSATSPMSDPINFLILRQFFVGNPQRIPTYVSGSLLKLPCLQEILESS